MSLVVGPKSVPSGWLKGYPFRVLQAMSLSAGSADVCHDWPKECLSSVVPGVSISLEKPGLVGSTLQSG